MVARLSGRHPHAARVGALAGLVPAVMVGAWILVQGWSGGGLGFVIAITWISLVAIASGWLVGARIRPTLAGSLMGAAAFGFVASLIWIPVGIVGSVAEGIVDGRYPDVGAVLVGIAGFLAYGFLTATYVWILLLPLGVGWIVAFRSGMRRAPPAISAPDEPDPGATPSSSVRDRPMGPLAQWMVGFGLGVADATLVGLGGFIVVVALMLGAIAVALRHDALAAISGLLVGAGTAWLAFMATQAATGGQLPDAGPWLLIGVVPTAIGTGLGLYRLKARGGRH